MGFSFPRTTKLPASTAAISASAARLFFQQGSPLTEHHGSASRAERAPEVAATKASASRLLFQQGSPLTEHQGSASRASWMLACVASMNASAERLDFQHGSPLTEHQGWASAIGEASTAAAAMVRMKGRENLMLGGYWRWLLVKGLKMKVGMSK